MRKEYIEGTQATENFEHWMKSLFKFPKDEVGKAEKRKHSERSEGPMQLADTKQGLGTCPERTPSDKEEESNEGRSCVLRSV